MSLVAIDYNNILDSIQNAAPSAKVDISTIARTLYQYGPQYGVDSEKRIEAFLAQAAHETAGFKTLQEYASGSAYEGRSDLGNTQPGDGVKFKGRGIFQITGRANYRSVSRALFGDDRLLSQPELLEDPKYATLSALYYWQSHNLNQYADSGDFETLTKRINGGLNGWKDRLDYWDKFVLLIKQNPTESTIVITAGGLLLGTLTIYYIYRAGRS